MSNLQCPCGNTSHFRGVVIDHTGGSATCGECGTKVTTSGIGNGSIVIGATTTGGAFIGNHQDITFNGDGSYTTHDATDDTIAAAHARAAAAQARAAAAQASAQARAVAAHARAQAAEARAAGAQHRVVNVRSGNARVGLMAGEVYSDLVVNGPAAFGFHNTVTGPGARVFGAGSVAYDTSRPAPTRPEPENPPQPAEAATATAAPVSPASPTAAGGGPAATAGPGVVEVLGHDSAKRYATAMAAAAAGVVTSLEQTIAAMTRSQVTGPALGHLQQAKEHAGQLDAAIRAALAVLNTHDVVSEGYTAVPDAGDKPWMTE